ncbi:hypothetical protein EOD42_07545 [Rhodovarius crocodyli]|uniref:Uncharacterized protein n=1 Tax=Rhodovarius crocodyli TaxID=1979269 RepID=A0A437MJ39_9PROT|nr:hypothetical protein [Rhodovarius crocodyli]RVT97662.1 hypothetical protein EOD42_07545 [Rhodovarius crocodyli]
MADDMVSLRRETAQWMQTLADRAGAMDVDAEVIRTAARFGELAVRQIEIEESELDFDAMVAALGPVLAEQREVAGELANRPVWSLLGLFQLANAVLVGRPEMLDLQAGHTTEHALVAVLLRAVLNLTLQVTDQPPIHSFFPSLAPKHDA